MDSSFCVHMYCDGSCLSNPGPGGWAALLIWQPKAQSNTVDKGEKAYRKTLSGHQRDTTNNRMELTAAIEGLSALNRFCNVHLFCDSQYVVKGMSQWMDSWQKRDWKTANGKPVENRDLWKKLAAVSRNHHVVWNWVKAHAGNVYNEYVDEQARIQARLAHVSMD